MARITKQKIKSKIRNKNKNNNSLFFVLGACIIGAGLFIGLATTSFVSFLTRAQDLSPRLNCPPPGTNQNAQLINCNAITPILPPAPPKLVAAPGTINIPDGATGPNGAPLGGNTVCVPDAPNNGDCQCPPYEEDMGDGGGNKGQTVNNTVGDSNASGGSGSSGSSGSSSGRECNSKPIIYLYPTHTTQVSVTLDIPGNVTVSDPAYPLDGWNNIEAHSDGTFVYNQKTYHELYYESETIKANPPKEGIIVSMNDLRATLLQLTTKLGLNNFEQKEFMNYWMPQLEALHSPYIFVSVLDQKEKEKVDHVIISPQPDTKIEFLAYFKAVDVPYPVNPLQLNPAPKRNGFTTVEWGGTIDR